MGMAGLIIEGGHFFMPVSREAADGFYVGQRNCTK